MPTRVFLITGMFYLCMKTRGRAEDESVKEESQMNKEDSLSNRMR